MTGLQRTMSALSGEAVVPPAHGVTFLAPGVVLGARDSEAPERDLARAYAETGLDFAFVMSWEPWAGRLVGLLHHAGIAALWVVPGVLWPALEVVGVGEGLRATAREPDSLAPELDSAAGAMRDAVALGVGLHADAMVIAEDLAGETGALVAPDFVSDHVLPRLSRGVATASRGDIPVLLHSDGDISVFLSGLRDAGFAGVHAGGPDADAFGRLHARARRSGLAIVGGLPARGLAKGLPAAVLAGTSLAILAQSGGLLVADDGGITTPEEYSALLAAFAAMRD